jgi:uroporphyrinogen decarboxylase
MIPFLDSIRKKSVNTSSQQRTPVWLMRQAGRYLPEYREVRATKPHFLDLCYSPKDACEVTLQPLRRFDLDAAIIFSDILVIPDALGCDVSFVAGEGPKLSPIRESDQLQALTLDGMEEKLSPVYEALDRTRDALDTDKALIGFAGAPWTLACYMIEGQTSRDYASARRMALSNPVFFQQLIDLLTNAVAIHLIAQARAGAQVVKLFDSWAGILPPEEFRKWCMEPARKIVAKFRESVEDVPVIASRVVPVFFTRTTASMLLPMSLRWIATCRWNGPKSICNPCKPCKGIWIIYS